MKDEGVINNKAINQNLPSYIWSNDSCISNEMMYFIQKFISLYQLFKRNVDGINLTHKILLR